MSLAKRDVDNHLRSQRQPLRYGNHVACSPGEDGGGWEADCGVWGDAVDECPWPMKDGVVQRGRYVI
ncbi:MAG: hypothetical protein RLZZ78_1689 [Armatimonadota bacterium]